jgi:lipopolysaccharide assembly outer membrane protein LptD (OstA)
MNYGKKLFGLLFLLIPVLVLKAQVITPQDTANRVQILNYTRQLTFKTIDDTTKLTIIVGTVKMRQGTSTFYCDSCVINNNTNVFEAWGNVHINDSDTTDVYSNHLRYLTKRKLAYLDGNVKLSDGKAMLTTPDLEYDMETNIGTYKNGGKVTNKKTVLTSKEGVYYSDLKDVYFKNNVVLIDPAYKITTDSLLYNSGTQTTRFISQTTIVDSSGRTIRTRDGYYNQQTGKAEFGQRPEIVDGDINVRGDRVSFDDSTGIYVAEGNAIIKNTKDGTTIIGGIIIQNKNTNAALATRKPLMIIKQNEDSTYITGDTLFTARLTDRFGNKDSIVVDSVKGTKIAAINEKDSTNRYFEAYRNVRIFNDSLQAVCDSMFYSFKDSVFRLYDDPVVWAQKSQITGDTILLFTKNKKADKVQAFENGFMINEVDKDVYNQIKSTRIDGWFIDGNIDSVRARGLAECIYYIQDDDSAFTGVNQSKSDLIDIYFAEKTLSKVVFRSEVTGTIWPMKQKSPSEMILPNFRWLEERRPKTKFELYE